MFETNLKDFLLFQGQKLLLLQIIEIVRVSSTL